MPLGDMVINVIWNRSCGPGGGTRRLHQNFWGRNRIDVLNKGIIFTRYDSTESFYSGSKKVNANDNNRLAAAA